MNQSDVEAAMKAAGFTAGDVVSIGLGPEPTNPGIWRVCWNGIGVPEIPVTEEMIAAARSVELPFGDSRTFEQVARLVYRAMAAVAPPRYSCGIENHEALIALEEKDARIAALEADNAAMQHYRRLTVYGVDLTEEESHRLWRGLTAFTADQPDLPDPPRRPDGTLMPQPKALTLPRETGDKRRIGG